MWQNIIVFAIVALAGGITLWRVYKKFTGQSACCGGEGSCKGSCGGGVPWESGKPGGKSQGPAQRETTSCGSCCNPR